MEKGKKIEIIKLYVLWINLD